MPLNTVLVFIQFSFIIKLRMSPVKMVIGVVPSKNGNQRPGKVVYLRDTAVLLCLPLCWACCLWFRLRLAGWLPCWERVSHSALRVCFWKKKCNVFVYVRTLNLISVFPLFFLSFAISCQNLMLYLPGTAFVKVRRAAD